MAAVYCKTDAACQVPASKTGGGEGEWREKEGQPAMAVDDGAAASRLAISSPTSHGLMQCGGHRDAGTRGVMVEVRRSGRMEGEVCITERHQPSPLPWQRAMVHQQQVCFVAQARMRFTACVHLSALCGWGDLRGATGEVEARVNT